MMMMTPTRIRRRVKPPPRPMEIVIRLLKKSPVISVEIQPRAVLTSFSAQVPRGVSGGVAEKVGVTVRTKQSR